MNPWCRGLCACVLITVFAKNGIAEPVPFITYDYSSGNVKLFPDGAHILSFFLQSNDLFLPPADFSDLEASTFGIPGLTDNLPSQIGWVSPLAAGGLGFGNRPEDVVADLGEILPAGNGLPKMTTTIINGGWAGPGGTGGELGLGLRYPRGTPHADAGGPYTIGLNDDLILDPEGTFLRPHEVLAQFITLRWDLDLDGEYDDDISHWHHNDQICGGYLDGVCSEAIGTQVISNAELPDRFNVPGTYEIRLEAQGNTGPTDFDSAFVTVVPEPDGIVLMFLGSILSGGVFRTRKRGGVA